MLHPLRPPLIGLYPGHPHPLLASLSHGDFRDWENEKSYALEKRLEDQGNRMLHGPVRIFDDDPMVLAQQPGREGQG